MRISIGTEGVLGIKEIKNDAPPTTAYLMLGARCMNNCLFCAQARNCQADDNMLSRVSWGFSKHNIWALVEESFKKKKIERACIQVIHQKGIFPLIEKEIKRARKYTKIPLCISGGIGSLEEVERLIELGTDRISIALDAATPKIFRRVKGVDHLKRFSLLEKAARKFPGRIGTHLIVGLGETEEEMLNTIHEMYIRGINVALFAFTPIKGTFMEGVQQPPIDSYRRIQIARYLIFKGICEKGDIKINDGKIESFSLSDEKLRELLSEGEAFMTSGCTGCNRPYYNESPGSTIYNYPRKMTEKEIEKAIAEATHPLSPFLKIEGEE